MPGNGYRSFSEVLEGIVGNVQEIIRSEVRLAKAEVREETGKAAKAARVLGIGALLALYALGFLLLTGLHALEIVFAPWLAAMIVTLLVGGAAAILIRAGIGCMKRVDPRPDRTINTIKENIDWVKDQMT
jgi:uncharacterized membrane protein YqjE